MPCVILGSVLFTSRLTGLGCPSLPWILCSTLELPLLTQLCLELCHLQRKPWLTHTHPRQGLPVSGHPSILLGILCEMTDSCPVSTAALLSQHSADPQQTQPRPGIDVSTACLLSREQNRIHPAAFASKQASKQEARALGGPGDMVTSHTRELNAVSMARYLSLSHLLCLFRRGLSITPQLGAP